MRARERRLIALEAACHARPSRDALAQQFGADLATVYGGPAEPVTLADALAAVEEVYGNEDA